MSKSENEPVSMIRLVTASLLGNVLEWYDFFLYGTAAALIFGDLFFPKGTNPILGTLGAFAGFAIGFIARPLGGLFFGHIGDKFGHSKALVWTLSLMGVATFCMGILPDYHQAGWLAPVALIVLRIIQGAASGGEWSGGVLILSENAPERKSGFFASFSQMGVSFGFCLASIAFSLVQLLPHSLFISWGWRLPFIASILLFAVGIYIRLTLPDNKPSVSEIKHHEAKRIPVLELIRHYPKPLLQAMGLRLAENGAAYIFMTFSIAFARFIHVKTELVLMAATTAMVIEAFSIIIWGWISDRLGRRTVYTIGCCLLLIWCVPFFSLIATGNSTAIFLALIIGLPVCHGSMIGTQPALMSSLFPAEVRYTGVAMGHEVASIVAGGFAPMAATALYAYFHSSLPVSIMLAVFAVLTGIAILTIKR